MFELGENNQIAEAGRAVVGTKELIPGEQLLTPHIRSKKEKAAENIGIEANTGFFTRDGVFPGGKGGVRKLSLWGSAH